MEGLSFREFLELFYGVKSPVFSMEEILAHKAGIDTVEHPLPYFREYLARGYYPFSSEFGFGRCLQQAIAQTVESDIAQYADMKASTARKLKKDACHCLDSRPIQTECGKTCGRDRGQ